MNYYIAFKGGNKVVAYSTSEELVTLYVDGLSKDKRKKITITTVFLTKDERKELKQLYGNKELVVAEFLGNKITPENEEVYASAQEEYDKLKFIVKDLESVIENYSLHKDDKKILKKAHSLLKDLTKKKNFCKATGFDTIRELEEDGKLHLLQRVFNFGGKKND